MNGSYSPALVGFSIIVAIFASYTALDLASGVTLSRGRARLAWLSAGAIAMGVGIWSMHFVGMLAFHIPGMPISYDVPLMALSTGVAVVASGLALFVVSRPRVPLPALVGASFATGAAIAGMHYIGMWSMRMAAVIDWHPGLVVASLAIAVSASFVALFLAIRYRSDRSRSAAWLRVGGATVMGFAIAGMHYTAMAASRFIPVPGQGMLHEGNVLATDGLGVALTGTTLLILAIAIAGSSVNRELARRTSLVDESARLQREAGAARQQAETLADAQQRQTAQLQDQAAELEAMNEELVSAEGRLRGIIDSSLDAMVATDENSVIVEWSRHAETLFGWSAKEAIGRSLTATIIPPRYAEPHRRGVARYLATGEGPILNQRIEITALRRDGSEFPIELAIAPVRLGNEVLFTSSIRDLTERKQGEAHRRQSEAREQLMNAMELERSRLTALFEQAPAFIALLHGPDHVFELRNARYDQLVAGRDILGKPIRQALPELEGQGYFELLDRVYATGGPHVGIESRLVLRHSEGGEPEEHYINFVYQPFAGIDGAISGIFVHGVEVTDIIRGRAAAEAANRAKNEFLSRMSHELRTPLNAILGFGQLLEMEVVNAANRESVEQIVKAGDHLLAMINEVLDISRIEAGQISLSLEPVPVSRVVRDSVDLVRVMAEKQGITLSAHGAIASERVVQADQQRLKQVLLNLLTNAIKYNRRAGTVTVTCEDAGDDRLRIVVSDTGFGIPADRIARLFTPFERLGAEQSTVEGSGLGLALSRGLMQAMGGTLDVESVEGAGTKFWAELPIGMEVGVAEAAPDVSTADVPSEFSGARHTVLVVEDNLANVRLMERIFQRRPQVRLLTAMQGRLGLELAREHRPDLIILDLNLPDLPGDKVLVALRQDPDLRGIPIVMISGDAIPSQAQRILDLGAHAYLTKPFNLQELFRVVDEALRQNAS